MKTTLCGSFRKDLESLAKQRDELLSKNVEILSPVSVDFVDCENGFARTKAELKHNPKDIEAAHIEAIKASDFVWLFAPEGYVGLSAGFEIGVASTLGIPIFSLTEPVDITIREFVTVVPSITSVVEDFLYPPTPSKPLKDLQAYYARMSEIRGFSKESARDTLLLMVEEVGELARAVRKHEGLARDKQTLETIESEAADIQLYLLHFANNQGFDLGEAVRIKETINHERYNK